MVAFGDRYYGQLQHVYVVLWVGQRGVSFTREILKSGLCMHEVAFAGGVAFRARGLQGARPLEQGDYCIPTSGNNFVDKFPFVRISIASIRNA